MFTRRLIAFIGCLVFGSAVALAQNESFTNFMQGVPQATLPLGSTDRIPVVQGGATKALNGIGGIIGPSYTEFAALSYGSCVWDASSGSDVGPCILAARDAAIAFPGGGCVVLPAGSFSLKTSLTFTTAICLRGAGSSAVTATTGTELIWNGAAAGRMMSVIAPSGSTANKRLSNVRISDITFNGHAGLAADGLYLSSLFGPLLDRVIFAGFNGGTALNLDVVSAINGSTFGDAIDLQKGSFRQITILQSGFTSVPLRLGNFIDGTGSHGNVSFNRFDNLAITGNGGVAGILCVGCDNNDFDGANIAGTTLSVDMSIAVSGAQIFAANGNTFHHYQGSGTFIGRGQTTFPTCVAFTLPAPFASICTYANTVDNIDLTNGSVAPTIEPGAQINTDDNFGGSNYRAFFGVASALPAIAASNQGGDYNTCQAAAKTNAAGQVTTYLCNSSSGHIVHFDNLAGSRFGIVNDASSAAGNLTFRRSVGTGHYIFRDTPIATDNFLVSQLPACNAGLKGSLLAVSDATAPTYNATLTGGGAVQVLAQCNGTNWTAH